MPMRGWPAPARRYKNAEEFTREELGGIDVATARAQVRVAEHATAEDLERYGVT